MDFAELVGGTTPALADGAMGTLLFEYGLSFGEAPETWNLLHPELVRKVHRGYLEAGSQIVLTNTFGGNRSRLAMHNLEERVPELNRTAAVLARSEVEQGGWNALVAGDIGPTGEIFEPLGTLSFEDAVAIFEEQAAALAGGGVDLFWVETLAAVEEGNAALEGIRRAAPGLPVIVTMTFDTHGRTMMGLTPEDACAELTRNGATAVGRQLRQRRRRGARGRRADEGGGAARAHPSSPRRTQACRTSPVIERSTRALPRTRLPTRSRRATRARS